MYRVLLKMDLNKNCSFKINLIFYCVLCPLFYVEVAKSEIFVSCQTAVPSAHLHKDVPQLKIKTEFLRNDREFKAVINDHDVMNV